jgi:hypothetical protein
MIPLTSMNPIGVNPISPNLYSFNVNFPYEAGYEAG